MDLAFNLLEENWISCQTAEGESKPLGLSQLFHLANQLHEIVDGSPLVRVALHRLLLAILYRTQKIESLDDWLALWNNGWDRDAIDTYLENWRDRFDLFSDKYPFFQRADLDLGTKTTPLVKLVPEFAAGNNKQLFDHSSDDLLRAFSPGEAARFLVATQYWSIGGGVSAGKRPNFTTSPLSKGACILPQGETLEKTLLLNLVPCSHLTNSPRQVYFDDEEDSAVWERAGEEMVNERMLLGVADYLTWQCRYIRLLPEPDGMVRHVYYAQGEKIELDGSSLVDPFHAYEKSKKEGYYSKSVNTDRAAWRDSSSLFNTFEAEDQQGSCAALKNLKSVWENRAPQNLPKVFPVFVGGIALPGGQPPPDLWIGETFQIPIELFDDEKYMSRLKTALALADDVRSVVISGVRKYATELLKHEHGSVDKDAAKKLADALSREADYWAALEAPFHQYLSELGKEETFTDNEAQWREKVRRSAIEAFDSALASQDATGRHLRALNAARASFYGEKYGLRKYYPKEEE